MNKDQKDQRTQLLRSGYSLSAAGAVDCHRAPLERPRETHLASVRLTVADTKAAAPLISAVIAAVSEEPGEILVGTSKTDVLLLFRVGDTYRVEVYDGGDTVHQFVYRDAACLFFATADAEVTTLGYTRLDTSFNVCDYTWKDGSPVNTRRSVLAPLYPDTSRLAFEAVGAFLRANGGRFSPLVLEKTPMELRLEQSRAERAARKAAGIADEDPEEAADLKMIAANPDLRAGDSIFGMLVAEARKRRLAARKAAAEQST